MAAMAAAGTVAVLLPAASFSMRSAQAPARMLWDAGVTVALATDCNPGSSPVTSLLLMLNMGCTLFGLTPEEALTGVTRDAARALGLLADRGTLEAGKRADIAAWDIDHPAELTYWMGLNPLADLYIGGVRQ